MKVTCLRQTPALEKAPLGRSIAGRKQRLTYYLKAATGPLAKMYWIGRLDELGYKP